MLFKQLLLDVFGDLSLFQIALRGEHEGLFIKRLLLQADFKVGVARFGLLCLPFEIICIGFHLRVREHKQNGVRFYIVTGPHQNPADLAVEFRLYPLDVFRNESSDTADVTDHRSTTDGADPDRRMFDCRRGWLELIDAPAGGGHGGRCCQQICGPADQSVFYGAFAFNIHA